ncbi:MAG: ROK family protein [Ruminococcaceae bacterium]|nr:ROK family protein [Oscillospiraceae bacterium]
MYYIGIDLGGTGAKAGIVTEEGTIIAKGSVPTKQLVGFEAIVEAMAKLALKVMEDASVSLDEIKCVGIGCPGSIDDKNGIVYYSNNLVMENAPICDEMKKYINKPIFIGNDANCAALGEFYNLDDDSVENFVAVTLGTGVGGGIILGKKLYTGFNGAGGEIGHINLCFGGEPCTCGRSGCWEAYASATALIRDTERAAKANPDSLLAKMVNENGGRATGKIPFDAAQAGDETGKKVVDAYISYVGEGIVDIINIFQPEVVAIGGGVCNQGDNLLVPLREYVAPRTYGAGLIPATKIIIASLGNDAGIIGAAFLGKE